MKHGDCTDSFPSGRRLATLRGRQRAKPVCCDSSTSKISRCLTREYPIPRKGPNLSGREAFLAVLLLSGGCRFGSGPGRSCWSCLAPSCPVSFGVWPVRGLGVFREASFPCGHRPEHRTRLFRYPLWRLAKRFPSLSVRQGRTEQLEKFNHTSEWPWASHSSCHGRDVCSAVLASGCRSSGLAVASGGCVPSAFLFPFPRAPTRGPAFFRRYPLRCSGTLAPCIRSHESAGHMIVYVVTDQMVGDRRSPGRQYLLREVLDCCVLFPITLAGLASLRNFSDRHQ